MTSSARWLAWLLLVCSLCSSKAEAALAACPQGIGAQWTGTTLRVGLKYAPPFVVEGERGGWTGLSVELWEGVAACLGARSRYVEYATTEELLEAVDKGEVDVAVSALSMSSDRERRIDFTHVFHMGSLGALVPHRPSHGAMAEVTHRLAQPGVAPALMALAAATLLVAYGYWRLERRRGNLFFSEGPAAGFYQSLLWSVQLVFAGRGDPFSIRHRGGQLLVLLLTFSGATIVSGMTALIASTLTLEGIDQRMRSVSDLRSRTVGVMTTGRAREWVLGQNMAPVQMRSWPQVQRRIDEHAFDALVHDRDILQYLVKERVLHDVRVEPLSFNPQAYAFALPAGSALRKPINLSLLALRDGAGWTALERKYLGDE
jgi:polar amino acid transport system substrate-binding protein